MATTNAAAAIQGNGVSVPTVIGTPASNMSFTGERRRQVLVQLDEVHAGLRRPGDLLANLRCIGDGRVDGVAHLPAES